MAERLVEKLAKARLYEAENVSEVGEQHRRFLLGVTRGHLAW
jgi:hypothetical protein